MNKSLESYYPAIHELSCYFSHLLKRTLKVIVHLFNYLALKKPFRIPNQKVKH